MWSAPTTVVRLPAEHLVWRYHGADVRLHRRPVRRHVALAAIGFEEHHGAGLAARQLRSLGEDALQHRLEVAGVLADQAEHLRRRRLELEGFS